MLLNLFSISLLLALKGENGGQTGKREGEKSVERKGTHIHNQKNKSSIFQVRRAPVNY